ncbi:MAG: MaoC family dehydratase N-terminal domain-containing protein [Chloroflexi bacterium]|nr:MaoC family dehydratase N-terminal domain-containing protein [Chloroflexota bacterium]
MTQPTSSLGAVAVGQALPAKRYAMTPEAVASYLQAVDDRSGSCEARGIVPPSALLAYALRSVIEAASLPQGTVHGSQEMEALAAARIGETVTCQGTVVHNTIRGERRFVAVDLTVHGEGGRFLLQGRATVVLPP